MTYGTQQVLRSFLVDCEVQILLCGHLHVPRLTPLTLSNGTQDLEVLECRCGTTTQRDAFPYAIKAKLPQGRYLAPNTLLKHSLVLRNEGLVWRAEIYWRNRVGKFVNCTSIKASPTLMPAKLQQELSLLP